jgi:hypothetical protein
MEVHPLKGLIMKYLVIAIAFLSSLMGCDQLNQKEASKATGTVLSAKPEAKVVSDLETKPAHGQDVKILQEPMPAKLVKETDKLKYYQVHYKFQEEQWNDPEILSTTRLQFAWVKPGDKENETSLWSMRLDGSDLRQVASKELLDDPTNGAIDSRFPIVRSPNNRYVAFAVKTCFSCSERRILDLETKEVIVAPMGGNEPDFQWMPDSKSIVFNAEGLMHYNLETRTGEYIRSRFRDDNWGAWHLIDAGKKIIVRINKKRYTYDFKTGELLKVQEGYFSSMMHGGHLTSDKKYWVDDISGEWRWSMFDTPNIYLEKAGETLGVCHASLTYKAPIYTSLSKGVRAVYPNGQKREIFLLPNPENARARNITLYNVQQADIDAYADEAKKLTSYN